MSENDDFGGFRKVGERKHRMMTRYRKPIAKHGHVLERAVGFCATDEETNAGLLAIKPAELNEFTAEELALYQCLMLRYLATK